MIKWYAVLQSKNIELKLSDEGVEEEATEA